MLLHDIGGDCKTKACTTLFGGEKRIEHFLVFIWRHPATLVTDFDAQAVLTVDTTNPHSSSPLRSLYRVDNEIQQDLLQLLCITFNRLQASLMIHDEFNVVQNRGVAGNTGN